MIHREYLASVIGKQIGVLTAGTNPMIGWEAGVLLALETDFISLDVVPGNGALHYTITIPISQIARVRVEEGQP